MPLNRPLSKQAEESIFTATHQVLDAVLAGESPDDAIVKTAMASDLGRGHVELLARAYNVSAVKTAIVNGTTPQEKSADVKLANVDTIMRRLYPETMTKAAAIVSDDFSYPPVDYVPSSQKVMVTKLASVDMSLVTDAERQDYRYDPQLQHAATLHEIDKLQRQVNDANIKAAGARREFEEQIDALANYFRQSTALPLASVRQNAELKFGKQAAHIIDHIADLVPAKQEGDAFHAVYVDRMPYSGIQRLAKLAAECVAAEAAAVQIDRESEDAATSLLCKSAGLGDPVGSVLKFKIVEDALGELGPRSPESAKQRAITKLDAPEHSQELRSINARTALHEMLNDSVISGHSSGDIADAYNPIAEMAPVASTRSLFARAMTRRALAQGGVDPFETSELAKSENLVRRNNVRDDEPRMNSKEARRVRLGFFD